MFNINLSTSQIQNILAPYGFRPDSTQCAAINSYISLLLQWNNRISLTTVVDPKDILRFHFGESLYAAVCVPILKGRLADVGSGAGFPGLPLRLALPALSLIMIESNTKKAAFLREAVRELNLADVEVVRERMEDLPMNPVPFDFIAARALGSHAKTLNWAEGKLSTTGKIVLWLGEEDAAEISRDTLWKWDAPVHIPGSERRFILSGSPIR